MSRDLVGMLLAAGRGERTRQLGDVVAKPALDVLGRPLLASGLDHLRRFGVTRCVVNLHRHAKQVAAAVRREAGSLEVEFSWEPELLGGAGGLAAAARFFADGPVLVGNADIWSELDLSGLANAARDDGVVLALVPNPDPGRWSNVCLGPDGRVTRILPARAGGQSQGYLFTGFQLIGPRVIAALPPPPAEMHVVWDALLGDGRLLGVVVPGSFAEAGTPHAYWELVQARLGQWSWIHPDADVGRGVEVRRSAVGAGCRVGDGATIAASVLLAGAAAAPGAELVRCVAAGPVVVTGKHLDALVLPHGVFGLIS
jgi:NDP-sugar pyrophosphorylase family protein